MSDVENQLASFCFVFSTQLFQIAEVFLKHPCQSSQNSQSSQSSGQRFRFSIKPIWVDFCWWPATRCEGWRLLEAVSQLRKGPLESCTLIYIYTHTGVNMWCFHMYIYIHMYMIASVYHFHIHGMRIFFSKSSLSWFLCWKKVLKQTSYARYSCRKCYGFNHPFVWQLYGEWSSHL